MLTIQLAARIIWGHSKETMEKSRESLGRDNETLQPTALAGVQALYYLGS